MSSLNADLAASVRNTRRGWRVLRASPWQYVQILSAFAAPAAVAAYVTASDVPEGFGRSALLYVLNAISASAAPVVVMTAVAAGFHGVTSGIRTTRCARVSGGYCAICGRMRIRP